MIVAGKQAPPKQARRGKTVRQVPFHPGAGCPQGGLAPQQPGMAQYQQCSLQRAASIGLKYTRVCVFVLWPFPFGGSRCSHSGHGSRNIFPCSPIQIEPYDQERWHGSYCQARKSRSNVEWLMNAFGIVSFFFLGAR